MVGAFVEGVARFFVGEDDAAAGGQGDAGGVFAGDAPGAVEGEDGAGGVGVGGGGFYFGVGDLLDAEEGVGEDFAQADFELAFLGAGEGGEIDAEHFGQLDQEAGGDVALIVLNEVEVAGGYSQALGE